MISQEESKLSEEQTKTWSGIVQQRKTVVEESSPQRKKSPSIKEHSSKRKVRSGIDRLDLGPRQSSRNRTSKPTERFTYTHDKSSLTGKVNLTKVEMTEDNIHILHVTPDYYVMVSAAKENNPDLFSFDEAMNSEHRSKWIEAAIKEITALQALE